jgi:hypothetical protein
MKRFLILANVAFAITAATFSSGAAAQTAPRFEVDASWPKDLPDKWIVGQLGGVWSTRRTTCS